MEEIAPQFQIVAPTIFKSIKPLMYKPKNTSAQINETD